MTPFTKLTAVAVPLEMSNVDTDKIFPARFLRKPRGPGFDRLLFHDLRFDAQERERPEFVLNRPAYRAAKIIVAGTNFGCGSSREAAVYALWDYGIRAVIASSFGDIHYENELQNGMLPAIVSATAADELRRQLSEHPGATLTIDLETQSITDPAGGVHHFDIDPERRDRLLKGLDDVGLVLQHLPEIEAFEAAHHAALPWLR
jgi:3-isopropylmalate/(R)-2-methylmalate dehydratase small subunit